MKNFNKSARKNAKTNNQNTRYPDSSNPQQQKLVAEGKMSLKGGEKLEPR